MTVLNPWSSFGLESVLVPGSNQGQVIYVNSSGNGALDTNSGLRPREAKLTIHGALATCSNYAMDTIVVLNYESATEITWPIAVDVHGVRIVGAPGGGYMPRYTGGQIINAASVGDTACMHMDANHIHIANLEFRAGASHGCIEFDTGNVSRHGIYNCTFISGTYGIYATGAGMPSQGPTVQHCYFTSSISADGIRYASNGPFARFEDNIFDSVGGIAINVIAAAAAGLIVRNRIGLVSDVAARAIVFGAFDTSRWLIADNQANYSTVDMEGAGVNNPYLDNSTEISGVNNWLLNYRNIVATLPA